MPADNDAAFHRQEGFWLKAASWTFGLWALMIPVTGKMVLDGQKDLVIEQKALMQEFIKYREMDERRMAIFEERQGVIIQKINQIETDHRTGARH